jgi:hypothetical protein
MCIHYLGQLFPLSPGPSFSPPTPSLPERIYSALFSNFVEEKTYKIIRKAYIFVNLK